MSLREAIRREILDAGYEGFTYGFDDETQSRVKVDEHTDAVITAMRDALLSDEALEAAADIWNHHHAPTCDRAIKAALTAIGVSIE